jgi:bleomycin hydrolase
MFRLVVNKKYASEAILKAFDTAPTMLTYDDPLFLPDE